jgi:hypothetical protein
VERKLGVYEDLSMTAMTVLDEIMTDTDRDRQSYLNDFRKEKSFIV